MRRLLIAAAASIAALTAFAAPSAAQGGSGQGFSASNGNSFRFVDGDPRNDRRRRRGDGDLFIGEWPQQGDTAWRPGSYNDWWHGQPERSYPAWMRRNQGCQRLWWSGGGWTC